MTDLTGIPRAQLRDLLSAMDSGDLRWPPKPTALMAVGLQGLQDRIAPLCGLEPEAARAVLQAVLAERGAEHRSELTLVWTGPDPLRGGSRDTTVIVRELLARAERKVLIGGCYFTRGEEILQPLHTAMLTRGVEVTFCMDVGDAHRAGASPLACAQAAAAAFVRDNWPFGPPLPNIYFDPRTTRPKSQVKLHAKCIVVDGSEALITSANFTYLGQHQNIETGVLIRDSGCANELVRQWRRLIAEGKLLPCPWPEGFAAEATVLPESWEDASDYLPESLLPLVSALVAAGVHGPDDYGAELTRGGITLAQRSLMHWGAGTRRLSLLAPEDAGTLTDGSGAVDGEVLQVGTEGTSTAASEADWAALAGQVKAALGRLA